MFDVMPGKADVIACQKVLMPCTFDVMLCKNELILHPIGGAWRQGAEKISTAEFADVNDIAHF